MQNQEQFVSFKDMMTALPDVHVFVCKTFLRTPTPVILCILFICIVSIVRPLVFRFWTLSVKSNKDYHNLIHKGILVGKNVTLPHTVAVTNTPSFLLSTSLFPPASLSFPYIYELRMLSAMLRSLANNKE